MQFAVGMIPDDVDTFEKLGLWVDTVLHAHGYPLDFNERPPVVVSGDSGIQSVFEKNGPFISHQKDSRVVFRNAYLLEDDYASASYSMDYMAAKTIITATPNPDFLNPNYTP